MRVNSMDHSPIASASYSSNTRLGEWAARSAVAQGSGGLNVRQMSADEVRNNHYSTRRTQFLHDTHQQHMKVEERSPFANWDPKGSGGGRGGWGFSALNSNLSGVGLICVDE